MKIIYKTGNALKGPERYTIHGCNSRGVMGSGIALEVKTDYPEAFEAYRKQFERLADQSQGLPLGSTIHVQCKNGRTIINAITQQDYGRDKNRVYVSYDAIRKAMKNVNANAYFAEKVPAMKRAMGSYDEVAMPLIGAGLANGSWKTISAIIEEESTNFQPVVYLFDGTMPST